MHVVFIASEATPYSKTGGLADVTGSLPAALAELGHEVTVLTPFYRETRRKAPRTEDTAAGAVPVGNELIRWRLATTAEEKSAVGGGRVRYGFIVCDRFFDREGLYGDERGEYKDSSSRFIFFSRAALAAAQVLGRPVDVYHCHDWQTAPVPVYLRLALRSHPFHGDAACLFTIHNLAHQGLFWHWDWPLLNLPWSSFNWRELEFYGKINLLKGGLVYADLLNTVSPTYAREIQSAEHGCGLEGVLAERKEDLHGVINGVDARVWNPATDALLPARYSAADLAGKRVCKEALLRAFQLPAADLEEPVVGFVGRLTPQKGVELLLQAAERILRAGAKLVVLGAGDEEYARRLRRLREAVSDKVGVRIGHEEKTAHLIEAGSDLFVMPSRFEPCGLSQLYSSAYGTVPVVRRVGGLADTVTDATAETLKEGTATGFVFDEFKAKEFAAGVERALKTYRERPEEWRQLVLTGMKQDWSWTRSALEYEKLYLCAQAKAAARRN